MNQRQEKISLIAVTDEHLAFLCELECRQDIWLYEEYVENDKDVVRAKYREQMGSDHHFDFVLMLHAEENVLPVGLVQIWSYVDYRHSWELGFALLPEYQGRGFGYAAIKQLLQFAFEVQHAHKVVGMCHSLNQPSIRLMERHHMRREGVFKQEFRWQDEWHDQYFYAILQSEWQQFQTSGK